MNSESAGALAGLNVLVLEDEYFIARALHEFLEEAGAKTVEIAKTLADAESLMSLRFDAAVLDVRVPDGFSYKLGDRLLGQGVGVTFHSGDTETDDIRAFPQAVFCSKPSTPDTLVSAVRLSLDKIASGEK